MPAYHQMGHDSQNLLGEVRGFAGAILSPINQTEGEVRSIVNAHRILPDFEFIFDPQLYFPRRADRGELRTWSYFPTDFETADMSSDGWWEGLINELCSTAKRLGLAVVCSPATMPAVFDDNYYDAMRRRADALASSVSKLKIRALQTVIVRLEELAAPTRPFEIATLVSNTQTSGVYLVISSSVKPRDELRDEEQLKGAMKLISLLEESGIRVLVGCTSSDMVLWKAAGATSCATGKFLNLRRFTPGRFNEAEEGGRQLPYWFEEEMLAFLRASDLARIRQIGIPRDVEGNPFGAEILAQLESEPERPWVGLGWRQYMQWFARMESRLREGTVDARGLVLQAEGNWQRAEQRDIFMEERSNNGGWLRPWLRALAEFRR